MKQRFTFRQIAIAAIVATFFLAGWQIGSVMAGIFPNDKECELVASCTVWSKCNHPNCAGTTGKCIPGQGGHAGDMWGTCVPDTFSKCNFGRYCHGLCEMSTTRCWCYSSTECKD